MGFEVDDTLGCCPKLMKNSIILVNSLLALSSLGLIGLGVVMYTSDYITLTGDSFANVVVVIGCAILFITFIGCCSACNQNINGLAVFGMLLILIIVAEAAIIIFLYMSQDETESFLGKRWVELSENNKEDLQNHFSCCGWNEEIAGDNCPEGVSADDYCWDAIMKDLEEEEDTILYIGLSILALELIMLMFTCSLRSNLRAIACGDVGPFYDDIAYA